MRSKSLIVAILAAIVVFTPSTAAMAAPTVSKAGTIANLPMTKTGLQKPAGPIAKAAGEYSIPTYDQRQFSDWWAMTYRCGQLHGPGWFCYQYIGQNLYKNSANHWFVVTVFTEGNWSTTTRYTCQVLTSWFNGFRENQESCS